MNTIALLFMMIAQGIVTTLAIYFVIRIMRNEKR